MLDDLKYIAQRDTSDSLGIVEKQPQQLLYQFDINISPPENITNIVICGMGGSALAGNMLMNWPKPKLPVVVSRGYHVPEFVDQSTLFISSSYSGNTEEELSNIVEAEKSKAFIVVLTAGGKLETYAKEHGHPIVKLPGGLQPRMAVWYMFRALLEILEATKLSDNVIDELENSAEFLEAAAAQWRPDVPVKDNYAKQIAEHMAGKTPVIYAGPLISSAAYKWKIDINENAKNTAFWNVLPEVNHNEMQGWVSHPIEKPFAPIELRSNLYDEVIIKQFDAMNKMLSGRMPAPKLVEIAGDNPLEQLLYAILLGDFASIYLGLINNVDPTDISMIEKFKNEL